MRKTTNNSGASRIDVLPGAPRDARGAIEAAMTDGLPALERAVRARGRLRLGLRVGGAAALAAAVALPLLPARTPPLPADPRPVALDNSGRAPTSVSRLVRYVATDTSAAERSAPSPSRSSARVISDDELLASLRAAGIRAGVVRTEGRVSLALRGGSTPES